MSREPVSTHQMAKVRAEALQRHRLFQALMERGVLNASEIMRGLWVKGLPGIRLDGEGLRQMGLEAIGPDTDLLQGMPLRAGGYGEVRDIYQTPAFGGTGEEPRRLHLGLDVFAAAGTEVFVPLNGVLHSLADNDAPLDYGPTLILEHKFDGFDFHTLYGHLSRESLEGLSPGQAFKAGTRLGRLGSAEVNGGWAPHLHFQIILLTCDQRGDFPGVFRESEAGLWRYICPDPRPLLGVAVESA